MRQSTKLGLHAIATPAENERMSPEKGPFSIGNYIFQPSFLGDMLVFGGVSKSTLTVPCAVSDFSHSPITGYISMGNQDYISKNHLA